MKICLNFFVLCVLFGLTAHVGKVLLFSQNTHRNYLGV
jgi:hypothetical protein